MDIIKYVHKRERQRERKNNNHKTWTQCIRGHTTSSLSRQLLAFHPFAIRGPAGGPNGGGGGGGALASCSDPPLLQAAALT